MIKDDIDYLKEIYCLIKNIKSTDYRLIKVH